MPALSTDIVKADVVALSPKILGQLADSAWFEILNYVNGIGTRAPTSSTTSCQWPSDSANDPSLGAPAESQVRLARIYLAAHLAYVAIRGATGAAGPVTGETAGGLRRTYGMINLSRLTTAGFNTTLFGQTYLALLETSSVHGPVVI